MSRRGENIHKRKDGRWEGRYVKCRDEAGRAKYASVYGKTYAQTKQKLAETKRKALEEPPVFKEKVVFKDVLWQWLDANRMKYKASTERKYQYMIEKYIIPELGNIEMTKIDSLVINRFLSQQMIKGGNSQKEGLSASYVRSMMLIINAAIQFAVRERFCRPLGSPIYKPALPKRELMILSMAEQRKFEEYLIQEMNPTKLGIYISLKTGLRIGEVCALTWDDIDFEEKILHVRATVVRAGVQKEKEGLNFGLMIDKPKTNSSLRDIPISSELFSVLSSMKKQTKSRFVISDREGFLSPRTYEYRYHRILDKCGIKRINYHALRHTFATRCIEAGVDVKSLSEILGHSNVTITLNTYVHSSMELKRKQMEKLSKL